MALMPEQTAETSSVEKIVRKSDAPETIRAATAQAIQDTLKEGNSSSSELPSVFFNRWEAVKANMQKYDIQELEALEKDLQESYAHAGAAIKKVVTAEYVQELAALLNARREQKITDRKHEYDHIGGWDAEIETSRDKNGNLIRGTPPYPL